MIYDIRGLTILVRRGWIYFQVWKEPK